MSYQHFNIKLHEAMTMPIKQSIRVWNISGLHVEVQDIPQNTTKLSTLVIKLSDGRFAVGVEWEAPKEPKANVENPVFNLSFNEGPGNYIKAIAKISTLEELKDKFPQLFELEGELFALC